MRKYTSWLGGAIAGIINGLLGSGGGMIVVPLLEKRNVEPRQAHATAIAVILPLTTVSVCFYLKNGHSNPKATLVIAAAGMVGGFLGAKLLGKIPEPILKLTFAVVILVTAVGMWN